MGGRARRDARRRGPRRLRADRARSGAGRLPRPRRAHQPAALVGRHPDRLRPRPARPARRRRGRAGRGGDGGGAGRPHRGVSRRACTRTVGSSGSWTRRASTRPPSAPGLGFARPPAGPWDRAIGLGSTTHITAVDGDGRCASVTCSNGTGSGLIVPGTGVHVNNMLGEEDLNPLGFHTLPAGRRVPSMMSPTVRAPRGRARGWGSAAAARTGSAPRSCRRSSGWSPTGWRPQQAVEAPRVHFEAGAVQAEPGIDRGPGAARGARVHGRPLGGAEPVLRRRARRVQRTPRPGSSAAAATRGGAGRSRSSSSTPRASPSRARSSIVCERREVRAMAKALLIIDFQNDFTSGGALEVPGGDEIAEPVKTAGRAHRPGLRHPGLASARPRLVRDPGRPVAGPLRAGHARRRVSPGDGRGSTSTRSSTSAADARTRATRASRSPTWRRSSATTTWTRCTSAAWPPTTACGRRRSTPAARGST